jgi:two-component system, cell cycle sensor histidine kinase and response regulator CckA
VTGEPIDPELAARALQIAPMAIAIITAPGTISWANPAYFTTTGRVPSILGVDFHDLPETDGTWSPSIRVAVDAALTDGTPSTFSAVRARYREQPRGVYLDVDIRALPGRAGDPRRALLVIRDVTDRESEHDQSTVFHQAFRSSTNAMQLTDPAGVMIDVNPAFERIYGYTRSECIGRKPNLVRSRVTPKEVYERMWQQLLDPALGYWSGELFNRDRIGRERPVLLTITAIRNERGAVTHYLGVAVDLSERRSWERRAAHTDKLASIGQLAAGVAHEINTPLANIQLVTESLRRRTADAATLARLDTMTEQIEAAARIVRGLLDFARREESNPAVLDLAEVVRGAIDFLRGKQSADVAVEEEYPAEAVEILGERGALTQVITNLLNNAYDAITGPGAIRVTVRRRGGSAEVEVVDSGPGIPTEHLPRIFEPFFTTKPEGQGTGLGLAICHGIVQSHRGAITVRNVPGGGAGFRVTLPLRSSGANPPPEASA